jgi:pimeloyl-ACP methyl ester carboxylesterase
MTATAAPKDSKKSTNVRTRNRTLALYRAGFRVLGATAPSIASRYAEQLFFTARRHPRPAWELELLDRARRFYVAHEGGYLPVWSWGNGPVVLLVHGWEGRGAQLGALVDPLVEAGYRVVTFDGPGHGDAEPTRASAPDLAIAIGSVADAVGSVHALVAHSMGALAATLALTRNVHVQRAVFLAPATDPRVFARAFAKALELSEDLRQRMVARIEERFDMTLDRLYAPALAAQLDVPLRVIHDREDTEVPLAGGEQLVAAWRGASLRVTSGLGHRRILKDASVIADTVAFVTGHEAARAKKAVPPAAANELEALGLRA